MAWVIAKPTSPPRKPRAKINNMEVNVNEIEFLYFHRLTFTECQETKCDYSNENEAQNIKVETKCRAGSNIHEPGAGMTILVLIEFKF